MTDVLFHEVDGIEQEVIERQCDGSVDRFATLLSGIGPLRDQEFQGVECYRDVACEDFEELLIAFTEGVEIWAFDVDGPDDLFVQDDWNGQRASRPFEGFQVHRIDGGVPAQVAHAVGGDITGYSVTFGAGHQPSIGGDLIDPHRQERDQVAGGLLEQTNFDHIDIEDVLGVVADIVLEQIDPLIDIHREDFVGFEVGQLGAGMVNGRQFLFLEDFLGHVAQGDHDPAPILHGGSIFGFALGAGSILFLEANGVKVIVGRRSGWLVALESGAVFAAGGGARLERAFARSLDFGVAEDRIELLPGTVDTAKPILETLICPQDRHIRGEDSHPFGQTVDYFVGCDACDTDLGHPYLPIFRAAWCGAISKPL